MKALIYFFFVIPMISFGQINPMSCGIDPFEKLKAEVHGDTVILKDDTAFRNCAATYEMQLTRLTADTLVWMQYDVGGVAYCLCHFNLSTTIDSLRPGNYFVKTYYTFSGGTPICYLGIIPFTISKQGSFPSYSVLGQSQSLCFPLGIPEINQKESLNVSIYPNPTSDLLKIITNASGTIFITVSDMQSNCVMKVESKSSENSINMKSFSKGLYFLNIKTNSGTRNLKVLKN